MHTPNVIAKLFGVEIQALRQVGGGFSHASIFHVRSVDQRVFALRRTPIAAALPQQRLRALHQLLGIVRDQGIAIVPVPLAPCPWALLQVRASDDIHSEASWIRAGSDLWQMEPWMPGSPADFSVSDDQLRSAFHCLHSFHASARTAISVILPNEWFVLKFGISPAVQGRMTIAEELASGQLKALSSAAATDSDLQFRALSVRSCRAIERWLPWLITRLTQLSGQRFELQPVVRDLWRAHVLFTGDRVTGLIDLSAAASDHVCLDLSRLLRSWFRCDVQRIRSAAEQFSALRPLNRMEWALFEALDAATVLLSPVTWLRRRFEAGDQSPCREDVLVRMTELAEIAELFRPLQASD
jgi:hypothetical protein